MALPKWNDERREKLLKFVGDESPVTQATVAEAATLLETTNRSISSKLRKEGLEVESAAATATKAYTQEQEDTLRSFVEDNSLEFTYAEIAEAFEDGVFTAKSIQGKILSMELTSHVKPAEKPEVVLKYTPEQEAVIVKMAKSGAFLEDIAEAVGQKVASVRGKCLSLVRAETLDKIPSIKNKVEKVDALNALGDISGMTVEEIAEAIEKTPRGVKTMLTRRELVCKDHDGAAKKAKAA